MNGNAFGQVATHLVLNCWLLNILDRDFACYRSEMTGSPSNGWMLPYFPRFNPKLWSSKITRDGQTMFFMVEFREFVCEKKGNPYPIGSMYAIYIYGYLWWHGSHQYTPVMLAFFSQHHGSYGYVFLHFWHQNPLPWSSWKPSLQGICVAFQKLVDGRYDQVPGIS